METQSTTDAIEVKDYFDRLITIGKKFEATSANVDISKQPTYFDLQRFKRAQLVLQKYNLNIGMASSAGLVLLLQLKSIYIPLIKTGKSRTVPDSYDRYTATGKYMLSLYETDFFDPSSEGWKNINLVRGMHKRIYKLMNEQNSTKNDFVWVNQYDMAITQFAFIGLFFLEPIMCGAYYISNEELSDVSYYWRIISYYLGIEERFNIFVYGYDLNKQLSLLNLILEHINDLLNTTRAESETLGLKMAQNFMYAFEDFNLTSSIKILDRWWSPVIALTGDEELNSFSLIDKAKYVLFLFYFKILFRSETLVKYMNIMHKRKFDRFCADGARIKPKLAKKYKDNICEL